MPRKRPSTRKWPGRSTASRNWKAARSKTIWKLYKNRFDPKQREFIKTLLVTNRAATLEFLKTQAEGKGQLAPARLHNRQTAQPMDAAAGGEAADEAALSAERNSAIEQHKIANRCSFQQAHDAVRRKRPELFGITRK